MARNQDEATPVDFQQPKWAAVVDSRDDYEHIELERQAETMWIDRAGRVLGLIVERGRKVSFYDNDDQLLGTVTRPEPLFRGPVGVPGCDCISCSGGLDR